MCKSVHVALRFLDSTSGARQVPNAPAAAVGRPAPDDHAADDQDAGAHRVTHCTTKHRVGPNYGPPSSWVSNQLTCLKSLGQFANLAQPGETHRLSHPATRDSVCQEICVYSGLHIHCATRIIIYTVAGGPRCALPCTSRRGTRPGCTQGC